MCPTPVTLRCLTPADVPLLRQLNAVFGEAFAEPETYTAAPPSDAYLESLLAKEHVVALVALAGEEVLGGLVAYELDKFEQARREVGGFKWSSQHGLCELVGGTGPEPRPV